MARDLRSFLELLEKEGKLYRVGREVDPKTEMSALVQEAAPKKAIFFERLKAYPGWRACGSAMGSRDRLALVFGVLPHEVVSHYATIVENKLIKPTRVASGPVKEIIWTGHKVDLNRLPIWHCCQLDVAPYLTWAETISKDPDTGTYNAAIVRQQIKGKNKTGIYCIRGRHTWLNYKKYEARNEAMPVAIVLGHHPGFHLAGLYYGPYERDEMEVAGAFLGEPLRLVPAETLDLMVPADAEIVLEGEVPPHLREIEGPFQEFTSYYCLPDQEPVVNIKAITMRQDAIYEVEKGIGTEISFVLGMAAYIYKTVKATEGGVNVKDVHILPQAGHFMVIIQLKPEYEGQAKNVLLTALSGNSLHPKVAIAVDEDVDLYNPAEVLWAMANRVNPEKDVFIIKDTRNHPFDLKLPLDETGTERQRVGSKMGIDATKPSKSKPGQRKAFERARPMGWGKVRLQDFLDQA